MTKPDRIIIDFPSQGIHESIVISQNQHSVDHLAFILREQDAEVFYDEFRYFLFREYIVNLQSQDWDSKNIKEMVNSLIDRIMAKNNVEVVTK